MGQREKLGNGREFGGLRMISDTQTSFMSYCLAEGLGKGDTSYGAAMTDRLVNTGSDG